MAKRLEKIELRLSSAEKLLAIKGAAADGVNFYQWLRQAIRTQAECALDSPLFSDEEPLPTTDKNGRPLKHTMTPATVAVALAKSKGSWRGAAKILGVPKSSLHDWAKKYKIAK